MQKNKGLTITLSIIAAVMAVLLLGYSWHVHSAADPHAGHNHGPAEKHHDTVVTGPQNIEDSYRFETNKDGTYNYSVTARNGGYILNEKNADRPVEFTVVSNDVVMMSGQAGTGLAARWAIFCDIQKARKSQIATYMLGAGETQVAVVENRTNKHYVFVYPQFDRTSKPDAYYELKGLKVVSGQEPDITYKQTGSKLKVTYATETGKETITINLK